MHLFKSQQQGCVCDAQCYKHLSEMGSKERTFMPAPMKFDDYVLNWIKPDPDLG